MTIKIGVVFGYERPQGKKRPAIVLRPHSKRGYYVAIYGTGTGGKNYECLAVEPKTRAGKNLKLTKTTYFYFTNLVVVTENDVTSSLWPGHCPPETYLELMIGCQNYFEHIK